MEMVFLIIVVYKHCEQNIKYSCIGNKQKTSNALKRNWTVYSPKHWCCRIAGFMP